MFLVFEITIPLANRYNRLSISFCITIQRLRVKSNDLYAYYYITLPYNFNERKYQCIILEITVDVIETRVVMRSITYYVLTFDML